MFQEFKSPWRFSTESGRVDGKGILSAAKEWATVKQVLCTFWTSQDSCLSELLGHWIEKEHDSCPRYMHLFLSLFLFASGCTLCKEKRDLESRKGSQMNFITMYLKRFLLGISLQNVQFFISNILHILIGSFWRKSRLTMPWKIPWLGWAWKDSYNTFWRHGHALGPMHCCQEVTGWKDENIGTAI